MECLTRRKSQWERLCAMAAVGRGVDVGRRLFFDGRCEAVSWYGDACWYQSFIFVFKKWKGSCNRVKPEHLPALWGRCPWSLAFSLVPPWLCSHKSECQIPTLVLNSRHLIRTETALLKSGCSRNPETQWVSMDRRKWHAWLVSDFEWSTLGAQSYSLPLSTGIWLPQQCRVEEWSKTESWTQDVCRIENGSFLHIEFGAMGLWYPFILRIFMRVQLFESLTAVPSGKLRYLTLNIVAGIFPGLTSVLSPWSSSTCQVMKTPLWHYERARNSGSRSIRSNSK